MGPPDEEAAPGQGAASVSIAGGDNLKPTSASPPDDMPEIEPKTGNVIRITRTRDVDSQCADCGQLFGNTGAAASHARSARHQVEVRYLAAFVFMPAELIGGTP